MITAQNKQLIRTVYEDHINTGRLEPLADLVSADYVSPTGERGPAGFLANIAELRVGFPDIQFTIDQLIGEDDRVVVRWTWQATHTGTFRGVAPSGTHVTNSGIAIYQVVDHKIVRNWLETDRLGALQQMGALPRPSR
jgi:predicted ester cyclase